MEEVKEESSQNCSDSEDSSSSQSSSTTEAEDIESDLESLEEHYYSDLRRYTATLERDFSQHLNRQQLNNQECFFFWPVPCALEALTVINLLVEIVHSHAWE